MGQWSHDEAYIAWTREADEAAWEQAESDEPALMAARLYTDGLATATPRRTRFPWTRRGVRIWHYTTDEGSTYRILEKDGQWRLKSRSIYGGPWTVEALDVPTFLGLHWLTLAEA